MDKDRIEQVASAVAAVRPSPGYKSRQTMHNIGFSAATATLGAQKQKDEQKADAEQPKPSAGVMLRSRNGRGKKQRGRVEDFAPELIVRYLSQREEEGEEHISQLSTPVVQRMETIAMFADISGFTTLTEYLDVKIQKGHGFGAEELAFWLNRYFELLVKHISKAGGDVLKFAGDAILVLWPPRRKVGNEMKEIPLKIRAHAAAKCGLEIQDDLDNAHLAQDVTLSVKIGVGIGEVAILHVGGVLTRIEYIACGKAVSEALDCEHCCQKGQVILSNDSHLLLGEEFVSKGFLGKTKQGAGQMFYLLEKEVKRQKNYSLKRTALGAFGSTFLGAYVPSSIVRYLDYQQVQWSAEIRTCSVMFCNLGFTAKELEDINEEAIQAVQDAVELVQRTVYVVEGSLNKFLVDDKGSTLLAVFGLSPLAHDDDPTRCILSSVLLAEQMAASIGVTSGPCFCGVIGTGNRCEYSILGDVVNTSARLMSAAGKARKAEMGEDSQTGFVYCDKASKKSAESCPLIEFADPVEMHLKGKSEATVAFSPFLTTDRESKIIATKVLDESQYTDSGMSFGGRLRDILDHVEDMLSESELQSGVSVASAAPTKAIEADGRATGTATQAEVASSATLPLKAASGTETSEMMKRDAVSEVAGTPVERAAGFGKGSIGRATSQALFTSTVVISGDTGSGKSRLLRHAVYDMMRTYKVYISPIIPPVETTKFGLTGLLTEKVNKGGGDGSKVPRSRGTFIERDITLLFGVTAALELSRGAKVWARVFQQLIQPPLGGTENDMAPFLALQDSLVSQEFAFEEEADKMCKDLELNCILNAIGLHQKYSSVIVVLDECQGFSDRDWDLTLAIAKHFEKNGKFLMLIACRPLQSRKYKPNFRDASPCYEELLGAITTDFMMMDPMRRDETEVVVLQQLQVERVPSTLLNVVQNMTGGNPLYIIKFCESLRKTKAVTTELADDGAVVGIFAHDAMSEYNSLQDTRMPIPYKVHRIISTFLDRLQPSETLLLKCASVVCIGQGQHQTGFELPILAGVFPYKEVRQSFFKTDDKDSRIVTIIDQLKEFGMIAVDEQLGEAIRRRKEDGVKHKRAVLNSLAKILGISGNAGSRIFKFSCGLLRDVVYNRMLFSQRRKLHKIAGDSLEQHLTRCLSLRGDADDGNGLTRKNEMQLYRILERHYAFAEEKEKEKKYYWKSLSADQQIGRVLTRSGAGLWNAVRKAVSRRTVVNKERKSMHRDEINNVPIAVTALEKQDKQGSGTSKPSWLRASSNMLTLGIGFNSGTSHSTRSVTDFRFLSDKVKGITEGTPSNVRHAATFSSGMEAKSIYGSKKESGIFASLVGSVARGARDTIASLSGMFGLASGRRHGRVEPGGSHLSAHDEGDEDVSDRSDAPKGPSEVVMVSERMKSAPFPFDGEREPSMLGGVSTMSHVSDRSLAQTGTRVAMASVTGVEKSTVVSSAEPTSVTGEVGMSTISKKKSNATILQSKGMQHRTGTSSESKQVGQEQGQMGASDSNISGDGTTRGSKSAGHHNASFKDGGDSQEFESASHVVRAKAQTHGGSQRISLNEADEMLTTSRGSLNVTGRSHRDLPNILLVEKFEEMLDVNVHVVRSEVQTVGKRGRRFWHLIDNINSWSFDIFTFQKLCGNQSLLVIANVLFCRHDFDQTLMVDRAKFSNFVSLVQDGYYAHNPYHNALHAADVLQTANCLMRVEEVSRRQSKLDIFILFLSCIIHDYKHPGLNSQYLIATKHPIGLEYGDKQTLERFHVAEAFKLLDSNETIADLLDCLEAAAVANEGVKGSDNDLKHDSDGERDSASSLNERLPKRAQTPRERIIDLVLATSLSDHFAFVRTFKDCLERGFNMGNDQERLMSLEMVIKAADVSNCAKPFSLYKRWANQIMIEFYKQGDVERNDGSKISNYMDRFEPDVSTCQLNFMRFIVCPLYELVGSFAPTLRDMYSSKLKTNVKFWEKQQLLEMGIRERCDSINLEEDSDDDDDGQDSSNSNGEDRPRIKVRRRSSLAAPGRKKPKGVSLALNGVSDRSRKHKKGGTSSISKALAERAINRRNTRIVSTLKASRALGSLDSGAAMQKRSPERSLTTISSMPGGLVASKFTEAEKKKKAQARAHFRSSLGRRDTSVRSARKFGDRFNVVHVPSLSDVLPSEANDGEAEGEGGSRGDTDKEEEAKIAARQRRSRIERRMSVSFL